MSPFSKAVAGLLDDTNLFDRDQWARFFGVPLESLKEWVSDKAIPTSSNLRKLYSTLYESSGVPFQPLYAYDDLRCLPSHEISPMGTLMGPSLQRYLDDCLFIQFGNRLALYSSEEQQRILRDGSWKA